MCKKKERKYMRKISAMGSSLPSSVGPFLSVSSVSFSVYIDLFHLFHSFFYKTLDTCVQYKASQHLFCFLLFLPSLSPLQSLFLSLPFFYSSPFHFFLLIHYHVRSLFFAIFHISSFFLTFFSSSSGAPEED